MEYAAMARWSSRAEVRVTTSGAQADRRLQNVKGKPPTKPGDMAYENHPTPAYLERRPRPEAGASLVAPQLLVARQLLRGSRGTAQLLRRQDRWTCN